MSRLAGVAKALYFPTPLRVVAGIARLIGQQVPQAGEDEGKHLQSPPQPQALRLLDPCCGKGTAAALFAHLLPFELETYGIELEAQRAALARHKLGLVLTTDAKTAKVSSGAFDIAFHNPPYDTATGLDKRLEHQFLKKTTLFLAAGSGLLVHIVPQHSLAVSAEYLSNHYEDVQVWRFPQPEYAQFNQVVVLARKKVALLEDKPVQKWLKGLAQSGPEALPAVPHCPTSKEELTGLLNEAGIATTKNAQAAQEVEPEVSAELKALGKPSRDTGDLEVVAPNQEESYLTNWTTQLARVGTGRKPVVFAVGEYSLAQALLEAGRSGVWSNRLAREQLTGGRNLVTGDSSNSGNAASSDDSKVIYRPLMPLRDGQAALLTSIGLLNNLVLTAQDKEVVAEILPTPPTSLPQNQQPGQEQEVPAAAADSPEWGGVIVVKGRAFKEFETRKITTDEKGRETSRTDREIVHTELRTLDLATGDFSIVKPSDMGRFIERYKPSIQRRMLESYPPRYLPGRSSTTHLSSSDPTIRQIEEGISRLGRKPLGGQRFALAGAALSLRQQRGTVISAEQGSGKSYMGAGAAFLAGMRRVVVVCPSHLTRKWVREVEQTIPGARGMVVRTVSDLARACREIERHEAALSNRTTLGSTAPPASRSFGASALPPYFVVISKEMLKLDSRWQPSVTWRVPRPVPRDQEGMSVLLKQPHCPRCGQLVAWWLDDEELPLSREELAAKKRYCLAQVLDVRTRKLRRCGEPLWQKSTKLVGQSPFETQTGYMTGSTPTAAPAGAVRLKAAPTSARRIPLATYIKRRLKGFFDLAIFDEVHQMKAKGSAQGIAAGTLASSCRRTLALSGTLTGGYSSTLFHLLYRFTDEIRADYRAHDEMGWAWDYGIIERTTSRGGVGSGSSNDATAATATRQEQAAGNGDGEDDDEEDEVIEEGAMSARKLTRVRFKEAPGINPAVLLRMIGHTIFLKLADVARELPPYREHVLELPMQGEAESEAQTVGYSQHESYHRLESDLYEEVKQQLVKGSSRLLGALVQSLLAWPDNPTQPEVVIDKLKGTLVASAPALPADVLYPKEQRLVELYRQEKAAGRKMLIFISNTGTRDLAPRLQSVLTQETEARVAVLKGSAVEADRREEWVERKLAEGIDVLICHPRLVETGLDLLAFPTLVFYQIEYSVYTQRQASRRSWRIGQRHPVDVYHFVYRTSSQARALRHQARKMLASNLLDGDLSSDGLVGLAGSGGGEGSSANPNQEEDNLMLEMARAIVQERNNSSTGMSDDDSGGAGDSHLSLEDLLAGLKAKELEAVSFLLENEAASEEELDAAIDELYAALTDVVENEEEKSSSSDHNERAKVSFESLREIMLAQRLRRSWRKEARASRNAGSPSKPENVEQLSLF